MSTLFSSVLFLGFMSVVVVLVVHLVRDMDVKTPTQGEMFRKALFRLERKSRII